MTQKNSSVGVDHYEGSIFASSKHRCNMDSPLREVTAYLPLVGGIARDVICMEEFSNFKVGHNVPVELGSSASCFGYVLRIHVVFCYELSRRAVVSIRRSLLNIRSLGGL